MVYTNEKHCFTLSKHSRVCAEHFTEGSFEQIMAVRSFAETLLKTSPTCTLFFLYKNVVFWAQGEYSYFSTEFRLNILL